MILHSDLTLFKDSSNILKRSSKATIAEDLICVFTRRRQLFSIPSWPFIKNFLQFTYILCMLIVLHAIYNMQKLWRNRSPLKISYLWMLHSLARAWFEWYVNVFYSYSYRECNSKPGFYQCHYRNFSCDALRDIFCTRRRRVLGHFMRHWLPTKDIIRWITMVETKEADQFTLCDYCMLITKEN